MDDYSLLEWDSRFFGYKIAAIKASGISLIRLNQIIGELREKEIRLAYCFASPDDKISNDSYKQLSALLADEKITYSIQPGETINLPSPVNIVPYQLNYASEKIITLALQSGIFSRFKVDPSFQNKEFEKLYIEWIEKSVNKTLASEVLVYMEEGEIYGFITLAMHGITGSIGLIAVDEKQRGKAIGKKLIHAGLLYFKDLKSEAVEVVTQKANITACRFYESCGFGIKNIVNIYHLWIS
jgi:dTDP-4-amino-4,6-dideoxy-D-galactose acyltransferase